MTQGPIYIFALQNKLFQFWNKDGNNIDISSNPYLLEFSPQGWDEIKIQNKRNRYWWGIDRTVALPLTHVKDGGDIIKHVAYTRGYEESLYLVVCVRNTIYNPLPNGNISINTLTAGSNVGNVSGPPNTTVSIKIVFNTIGIGGILTGNIGNAVVNMLSISTEIFQVYIPSSGTAIFSLNWTGNQIGTIDIRPSNANGTTLAGYGYHYSVCYRGEINLPDFVHNGSKVTCTTVEDGLPKYLKSNKDTVYEFSLDVPEAVNVKFDGIDLRERSNFSDLDGLSVSYSQYGANFYGPMFLTGSDGDHYGVEIKEEVLDLASSNFDIRKVTDNWFLRNSNSYPITVRIAGRSELTCTAMVSSPAWAFRSRIITNKMDISNQNLYPIKTSTGAMVVGQTYGNDFDFNIIVQPGETLVRDNIFFGGVGVNAEIQFTVNSKFTVSFKSKRPTTYVKHLTGAYLWQKLISNVTDLQYAGAISNFFEQNKDIVFTCGNSIRGLADSVIKIKLSDFFKWWDSLYSVGIKTVGTFIYLDHKVKLIDRTSIIDLSPPAFGSFKVSFDKEEMYNSVEIGYPEIRSDIGALNGNAETNTKFLYSMGTVKNPNVIDKISPFKSSCYEQEKIRTTILEKVTTDYKSDNDIFVNVIVPTLVIGDPDHYILDRTLNPLIVSGVLEPNTIWNLKITPGRMFRNNESYFRSRTYKMENRTIKFQSSDKNNKLICAGVIENESRNIGGMPTPFFIPVLFEGDFPAPYNLLELLDANPLQVYRFTIKNKLYIGIIDEVSIEHATRKVQQYKFTSVEDNDIEALRFYKG